MRTKCGRKTMHQNVQVWQMFFNWSISNARKRNVENCKACQWREWMSERKAKNKKNKARPRKRNVYIIFMSIMFVYFTLLESAIPYDLHHFYHCIWHDACIYKCLYGFLFVSFFMFEKPLIHTMRIICEEQFLNASNNEKLFL